MIKTLLKKQMMESFSWLYQNRKTGKNRDTKGIITYVILLEWYFFSLQVLCVLL